MITWTILSMESQPDTGIVVSANWSCIGEQDGYQSSVSGTAVFPQPDGSYVPYNDLTESQVLDWVWTDGGVDKAIVESAVESALNQQINPIVVNNPLPW